MAEEGETKRVTEEAGGEGAAQVGGGEDEQEAEEVFDPNQTYWLGYFRLPISDVKTAGPLTPNYDLLPKSARGKGQNKEDSDLYHGTWVYCRKKEGEEEEGGEGGKEEKSLEVLVKPISVLKDREARILSSVAGSEANAFTYNLTRFYGATLDEQHKEYCLVLEHCDCYLQDLVMDKDKIYDPKALCEEIAVGMRYLHWKAQYSPVIHRNLHPLSVLIKFDKDGVPHAKIHGFGHAKMLGKEPTVGGHTVAPNNPDVWCAPDLKKFTSGTGKAYNIYLYAKVDVYSFAILVWHIFTRELPLEGKKMDELKLHKMIKAGKKPVNLHHSRLSPFWRDLIEKGLNVEGEKRPDFMRIVKAIRNAADDPAKARQYLDSIAPEGQERSADPGLAVEDDDRPQEVWEIGSKEPPVREEHRIVPASDSKRKSSSVMAVIYEDDTKAAMKKLVKRERQPPSREEFADFVQFSRELNPQYILRCEGALLPDSLKMRLMECSVRQFMKGKKWGEGKRAKQMRKGFGSMRPAQVHHIALSVCKGLKHLHDEKNTAHKSISSSNVLLDEVSGTPQDWVVLLVDYALDRLGIASQSHAKYAPPEGSVTDKRADLYSLGNMIIEMYVGKLEPREKAEKSFATFPSMWPVVETCLDTRGQPDLAATDMIDQLGQVQVPH